MLLIYIVCAILQFNTHTDKYKQILNIIIEWIEIMKERGKSIQTLKERLLYA